MGSSHIQTSSPCQDRCLYRIVEDQRNEPFLIAVASDGAGSALHGEIGAAIACEKAASALIAAIESAGEAGLSTELVNSLLESVRTDITKAAEARNTTMRSLACTLLGAVIGPGKALYFQIGDGAIVARQGNKLVPVFWPESGEYANMTYFVTDADASDHLCAEVRETTDELGLFSDGLQRLALVFATESVHEPFFEPMFRVLRSSTHEQADTLCMALERFLCSKAVNERTDDDKTLVLATRAPRVIDVSGV
jgi:hypothetical protein